MREDVVQDGETVCERLAGSLCPLLDCEERQGDTYRFCYANDIPAG